jgi:AcrR family transcriptional regulator
MSAMTRIAETRAAPRKVHHRTTIGLAQRARTRAAFIQCAIAVFAEQGPDAPVIDDFAKAAGVSRGTFYNYFQTTRSLLDATVEWMSNQVIASIIPAVTELPDPLTRFATAARMYYRFATHNAQFRAFLGSISGVGSLAVARVKGDIEEAMAANLIRVRDIELAQAIATGVMVFALRTPMARTGSDDYGAEVVRAILRALGTDPGLVEKALAIALPELALRTDDGGPEFP